MTNTDFWTAWNLLTKACVDWKNASYAPDFVVKSWSSWDPLVTSLFVCGFVAFLCWFLSILTKNYSWVDKIWSITPAIYSWIYLMQSSTPTHPRLVVMTILPTVWGVRLSYNFFRKGGYTWHGEDYRWKEIQKRVHWILYQIFNATFIAPYQNILLWLIISPMWIVYHHQQTPWNIMDWIATAFFVAFLLIETIADEQQWNFHAVKQLFQEKGAEIVSKSEYFEDVKRGFLASKLFRYSRHPNFFSEMSMWWMFYLFSVAASGQYFNWTIIGTILLSLLFQGSTDFTESLTKIKYPKYLDYQKVTNRLIPWFPSGNLSSKSD